MGKLIFITVLLTVFKSFETINTMELMDLLKD